MPDGSSQRHLNLFLGLTDGQPAAHQVWQEGVAEFGERYGLAASLRTPGEEDSSERIEPRHVLVTTNSDRLRLGLIPVPPRYR